MFVHVDISFDYLNAIANHVFSSGDVSFATNHWASIEAAYHYCLSLIGSDGLPHIPPGKEGADEQHRPAEDLGLSANWVAATHSFAELAKATGHAQLADEALQQNKRAWRAVASHFWDEQDHFWINGFTRWGRQSSPAAVVQRTPSRSICFRLNRTIGFSIRSHPPISGRIGASAM